MGLFKKTEGATAVVEPSEIDALQRQIGPLTIEIGGLRERLRQEERLQSDLQSSYDAACIERIDTPDLDLRGLREEIADLAGLIAGLEKVIARKAGELRPVEARYNELREAQNERAARRAELEWLCRHGLQLQSDVAKVESMGGSLQASNPSLQELLHPPSFCERALHQARRLAIGLPTPIKTVRASAERELEELQDRLRKEATE